MFKTFCLTVCNDEQHYDVFFDVLDNPISQKWAMEISKNYELFETDRFSNWPDSPKNKDYFVSMLNKQIDTVNQYYPNLINSYVEENPDQETMNYLHTFFEKLRGPIGEESDWYKSANTEAQEAICQFNILIHEYEHYSFNEEMLPLVKHPYATIVGTYKDRPRYELTDDDYNFFTFNWRFGTVYINYCEVGKPLLDVFKDQDEVVGDNNIKPLKYYSADWQIKFGPDTLDWVYAQRFDEFKEWFHKKSNYFNQLGINWGPKLSLGMIPVAQLNTNYSNLENLSKTEIIAKLSPYQKIQHTWIK
jgi:hypothetical protein